MIGSRDFLSVTMQDVSNSSLESHPSDPDQETPQIILNPAFIIFSTKINFIGLTGNIAEEVENLLIENFKLTSKVNLLDYLNKKDLSNEIKQQQIVELFKSLKLMHESGGRQLCLLRMIILSEIIKDVEDQLIFNVLKSNIRSLNSSHKIFDETKSRELDNLEYSFMDINPTALVTQTSSSSLSSLSSRAIELSTELRLKTEELIKFNRKIDELTEQNRELQSQNAVLQTQLSLGEDKARENQDTNFKLTKSYEERIGELTIARDSYALNAFQLHSELNENIEILKAEKTKFQAKEDALTKQIEELTKSLTKSLEHGYKIIFGAIQLKNEIDSINNEFSRELVEIETSIKEELNNFEQIFIDDCNAVAELLNRLTQDISSSRKISAEILKDKINDLRALKDYEDKLILLTKENLHLTQVLELTETSCANQSQIIKLMEKRISDQSLEILRIESENRAMRSQFSSETQSIAKQDKLESSPLESLPPTSPKPTYTQLVRGDSTEFSNPSK